MPHTALCGYLQHGANEDAVDAENRSPLHWAGVRRGTGGTQGSGTVGGKGGSPTFGGQDRPVLPADMVEDNIGSQSD